MGHLLPPPWPVLLLQPLVTHSAPVLHQHLQMVQMCPGNLLCLFMAATAAGMSSDHSHSNTLMASPVLVHLVGSHPSCFFPSFSAPQD